MLSFIISVGSILTGIIVLVGCFIIYGKAGLLEGSAAWILGILGAPTTFLYWFISKIGLSGNLILQYFWVCLFFLLQYQIIALLIYKSIIDMTTKKGILYLIGIIIIILISAKIMWNILGLSGPLVKP